MIPVSVLRVSTSEENFDNVIASLENLPLDAKWRRGERHGKRVHEESGANFLICEVEDLRLLVSETRRALENVRIGVASARALGAEMSLDFGFDFAGKYWARSLCLSIADQTFFAELGLEVVVSAYAGGDDD